MTRNPSGFLARSEFRALIGLAAWGPRHGQLTRPCGLLTAPTAAACHRADLEKPTQSSSGRRCSLAGGFYVSSATVLPRRCLGDMVGQIIAVLRGLLRGGLVIFMRP